MTRYLAAAILTLAIVAPSFAAPPNVVMIVGDDQGWKDYGFMGGTHVRTPNLDKLAAESLVYKRGYVPSSLCRPSLASMITGLFPHQHGTVNNDPTYPVGVPPAQRMKNAQYLADRAKMVAQFEKVPNLARWLGEAGYASHQSGKWWEGNACRCGGFTEGMTHGDPTKGGRHGDEGLTIGRQGLQPVSEFLDARKGDGKPFYVWYAPMMPHSPHNPPERLLAKYTDKTKSIHVARYWAMVEWFDETVGELLARLEKNGQASNTVVIYLHDNGWIQDENAPNYAPKSKQSPNDGGLRTPIMVRWPGKVKPAVSDALAQSIDLAPTILTAAGVKVPANLPGLNLLDPAAVAKRDTLFGEIFEHTAVELNNPPANLKWRWVVHGNWKLLVPNPARVPDATVELYDLAADPDETANLAGKHPDRVAELTKKLDAWWKP